MPIFIIAGIFEIALKSQIFIAFEEINRTVNLTKIFPTPALTFTLFTDIHFKNTTTEKESTKEEKLNANVDELNHNDSK